VIIGAAVLGEVLRPIQAVGALLTFVGVGWASSQERLGSGTGGRRVSPNNGMEPTR
jgi:drug/metabolite transporter (DMT)-like permease